MPGAEYDRDPDQIEFQARLIAASPALMALAERMAAAVDDAPDDAPPEMRSLAKDARAALKSIKDVLSTAPNLTVAPKESQAA